MHSKHDALTQLVDNRVNRRAFAQHVLAAGALVTGAALIPGEAALLADELTDVDILNFALNLEYLEAEFYTVATTGKRIADVGLGVSGVGRSGPTVGGAAVALTDPYKFAAEQITLDEQAHVAFLRTALGGAAVAKPAINLEALGVGFKNQNEFLALARAFEDVGVSAYGGAAPLIKNGGILGTAAQIALTEAQHAGVLRLLVALANVPVPLVDGMDIPPVGTPAGRLFQVDGQGRSTVRTANQVLSIVYATTTAGTRGGFYPDGMNGTIASV